MKYPHYFIQSGYIDDKTESIRWNYMGSSEYERGVLPRSIHQLGLAAKEYGYKPIPCKICEKDFWFVGHPESLPDFIKIVELAKAGTLRLKESINILQTGLNDETCWVTLNPHYWHYYTGELKDSAKELFAFFSGEAEANMFMARLQEEYVP